jgi:hypothetical protein
MSNSYAYYSHLESRSIWKARRTDHKVGRQPVPEWARQEVCHLPAMSMVLVKTRTLRLEDQEKPDTPSTLTDLGLCGKASPSALGLALFSGNNWGGIAVCFFSVHLSWVTCDACKVRLDELVERGVLSVEKERRVPVVKYP